MAIGSAAIALTPSWHKERIVLVCVQDGLRLRREGGHQALHWWEGYALVERVWRQGGPSLRQFVSRRRLVRASRAPLGDQELLALFRDALRSGELMALKVCEEPATGGKDGTAGQRKLVRKIEAATRGRLDVGGQQHKLVAGADLAKVPGRDNYAVVRRDEAQKLLGALAGREGLAPDTKELFAAARLGLAPDWRAPSAPDGLVLLRRLVTLASVGAPTEAPLTPSQMKKLLSKKGWIEVEVVDDKGRPYIGRYRLELPGGRKEEGASLQGGQWSNYELDPGECKLTLLLPDGGAPVGDDAGDESGGQGWLSLKMVGPDDKPILNHRYRIEFADGTSREGEWTDEVLRLEDIPEGKYTLKLLPEEDQAASDEA